MLKEKNALFTIGQFAARHEINKKTLMWYDEIGLLKPACIKENGYRYYSYHQSAALETILMLRELDVSLEEIRRFMENRSIDSLQKLMEEKIGELDEKLSYLRSVRKVLCNYKEDMETLRSLDLSAIELIEKKQSYLVAVAVKPDQTPEEEVERVIAAAKRYQLHRLHDASYGSMLPVEYLYRGRSSEYTAIYIEMPYPISKKGLHLQPAGTYLQAFYRGPWEGMPEKYEEILRYAENEGLTLWGHSYETGINELVIDSMEDYITRIQIPVKRNMENDL